MALHDPDLKNTLHVRHTDLHSVRRDRFEFLLALLMIAAGATFFLDPSTLEATAVGRTVSGWLDDAWSATYLVGGIGIAYGLASQRIGVEAAGLWLAITATMVNAYGIVVINAARSLSVLPSLVLTAVVCLDRLLELRRAARVVHDNRSE